MSLQLGNHTLSDEDLAVIAHTVHNETPEEWATRAFNYKTGLPAVLAKIERHRASYLAAKDQPGYQNAPAKMAQRRAEADQRHLNAKADTEARNAAADAALDARITSEVARQIAAQPPRP